MSRHQSMASSIVIVLLCLISAVASDETRVKRQNTAVASNNCSVRQFRCTNGQCIKRWQVCDGKYDCLDQSDENSALCLDQFCPSYAFRCLYGACIDSGLECNNVTNCVDSSDEYTIRCPKVKQWIIERDRCAKNEFNCNSGECIPHDQACNGKYNCRDKSDESLERCAYEYCPSFAFRCAYGACIDRKGLCNNQLDCVDGSDEVNNKCNNSHLLVKPIKPPTNVTLPTVNPMTTPPPGSCLIATLLVNGKMSVNMPGGKILNAGDYLLQDQLLAFVCNDGYRMIDQKPDFICNGETVRLDNLPTCSKLCSNNYLYHYSYEAKCFLNNAAISCKSNHLPKTIAQISCAIGYEKASHLSDRIICDDNGQWSSRPSYCEAVCGTIERATPLILSGIETNASQVPWHAAIFELDASINITELPSYTLKCGGTIFHPRMIISAAHCFWITQTSQKKSFKNIKVGIGKTFNDYRSTEEPFPIQILDVLEIVMDRYGGVVTNYESDIALLILKNAIVMSPIVKPICFDWDVKGNNLIIPPGTIGMISGWGLDESGEPSRVLKYTTLTAIEYNECKRNSVESFRNFIGVDKICVGGENEGQNVCQGDSGGGFIVQKRIQNEVRYYLNGIVSLGVSDGKGCLAQKFSVFTNVYYYISFIQKTLDEVKFT